VLISGCVRNDVVLCNKSGPAVVSQMILHSNSVKMGIRLCYERSRQLQSLVKVVKANDWGFWSVVSYKVIRAQKLD
jgi:hypothetical protein